MNSLEAFLIKHHVQTAGPEHRHGRSGWTQISPCPGCGSEKFHLGIRNDGLRCGCWRCGKLSAAKTLHQLTNAPWKEIFEVLGQGVYTPVERDRRYAGYKPPTHLGPIAGPHAKYLKRRGFDPEYVEKVWGCQATGPLSNYPFRIFIPITHNRIPVSWTARSIDENAERRYQTASDGEKSMDEKQTVFGLDKCKDTVIVVEGPTDTMNVGVGAAGLLGLAYTVQQVILLSRIPNRFICLDNSVAAQTVARKLASELAVFPGNTTVVELDAEDPGSAEPEEINLLRRSVGLGDKYE